MRLVTLCHLNSLAASLAAHRTSDKGVLLSERSLSTSACKGPWALDRSHSPHVLVPAGSVTSSSSANSPRQPPLLPSLWLMSQTPSARPMLRCPPTPHSPGVVPSHPLLCQCMPFWNVLKWSQRQLFGGSCKTFIVEAVLPRLACPLCAWQKLSRDHPNHGWAFSMIAESIERTRQSRNWETQMIPCR